MKLLIEWYKEAHEKGFVNTVRDIPDTDVTLFPDEYDKLDRYIVSVVTKTLTDQTGHRPIVTVMEE